MTHSEALAVWFSEYLDAQGNKHHFALREDNGQTHADFIKSVVEFQNALNESGFAPIMSNRLATQVGKFEPVSSELKSVEVKSISLASGGEHPRWLVKGGVFSKFGITIWPEKLQDAGILDKLDPLKDNIPQGKWLAWYTEKKNDEGKLVPDKVVRLERIDK